MLEAGSDSSPHAVTQPEMITKLLLGPVGPVPEVACLAALLPPDPAVAAAREVEEEEETGWRPRAIEHVMSCQPLIWVRSRSSACSMACCCGQAFAAGQSHQARLMRHDHKLDPVARPELEKQAGQVRLHGRRADEQLGGDLAVRHAASDENQHLALASGHAVEGAPRRAGP